jgi:hypothetical protein
MNLDTPPSGNRFAVDAYYGTAGVIKFQPVFTRVFSSGILNTSLECRKILERDWFGWGNNTDPDSSATMDFEMYHLLAEYTLPLSGNVFLTAGIDARHSSVFNREESILWSRMPGQVFDATLTTGLTGTVTGIFPASSKGDILLEANGFFQEGDVSYAGITGRTRLQERLWNGGEIALGARIHRQFNVSETPIPYTSGIGAQNDFRGFSDLRFTGPIWAIAQFEVRQSILTLKDEAGQPALVLQLAAFTEAGRTAESFGKMSIHGVHTDVGGGVRLGVGGDAMMRIDTAWGDEGMVLTTGFHSAF